MQCGQQQQLRLVAAGKLIAHAKKVVKDGGTPSDAFFVTAAGLGALGIADEQSACQQDGPTVTDGCAHTFISHCAAAFDPAAAATAAAPDPASNDSTIDGSNTAAAAAAVVSDLSDVLAAVQLSTAQQPGSVPLLLAALQPGDKLQVAAQGGCRMLLLRGGCVVAETTTESQLKDVERYTWDVQEGDLLIAGSDGLFNNLFTRHMLPLAHQALCGYTNAAQQHTSSSSSSARRTTGGGWDSTAAAAAAGHPASEGAAAGIEAEYIQAAVAHAAELLAAAAAKNAASRWALVPAAQPANAAAAGCLLPWLMRRGGKIDDVTCVVALATKHGARPSSSSGCVTHAAAAAAAVNEEVEAEVEAVFEDCVEQQDGPVRRTSSAAVSMHSCQSQDDEPAAVAAAAAVEAAASPAADMQQEELAVPAAVAASGGDDAAEKESAHNTAFAAAAAAAAESPSASSFRGRWALSAMHVARQSNKPSSAHSDASSSSSYSRHGSSASSRSYNMLFVPGAASSAAAGSSRPSSATGSYSSASERSMPPIKVTSSANGRLRMMPKSSGSTKSSTVCSVAGGTSGGYYWRAPKLGDSPTHVKREAVARRQTTSSRMLTHSSAAAAGDEARVTSSSGGAKHRDPADSKASLQQQKQLREPKPAAAAAAAAQDEQEEPSEKAPAGKDSAGQQLYVGSRVAVITDLGVAAVGRVRLLPGQKVDKWMEDKVWPEQLGIGDIRVSRDMQEVAQHAKFWVRCEGHGLYGNHPAYTFWSKRQQLQEKRICVSIPCSSLKLME